MSSLPSGTGDLRRRNADLLCEIIDWLCDKSALPRGNADLPGGKLDLPRGRANLLCGNADLLCGKSNLPRGKAFLPRGNVNLLCGNVDFLCGNTALPSVKSSRTESGALMRGPLHLLEPLRRALNSAWSSQVFPSSVEASPSQWKESGVISQKLQRVRVPSSRRPSWTMSSPSLRPIR